MKEFLPATAVMFFMGRILGGPVGIRARERTRKRWAEGAIWRERKCKWVDQRKKREGKMMRLLVDAVRGRLWNFRNKGEG